MNKYYFITLLIIGAGAVGYLFMRTGNTPNEPVLDTYAIEEEIDAMEDVIQEEDTSKGTALSCNAATTEGVCIELTGSVYADLAMAQMTCAETGTLEHKPCPPSPFGGCKTGGGTNMEMISYLYPNAENEMDKDSVVYAEMACNSNPMGQWVHQN
jgi:hypothetical protein